MDTRQELLNSIANNSELSQKVAIAKKLNSSAKLMKWSAAATAISTFLWLSKRSTYRSVYFGAFLGSSLLLLGSFSSASTAHKLAKKEIQSKDTTSFIRAIRLLSTL